MNTEQIRQTKAIIEGMLNLLAVVNPRIANGGTAACTVNWGGQQHCYEVTSNQCDQIPGATFEPEQHCTTPMPPQDPSDPQALKTHVLALLANGIVPLTARLLEAANKL
jgi:hypothetical protein